jgi:light-regulated signal transduction histidine kinase (bacteriophytochrome)
VTSFGVIRRGPQSTLAADCITDLRAPFRRLDRSFGGFSLGLSIVRSVVEAHHGTVEVIAPPSGGLELRVSLPRSRPADSKVAAAQPPPRLRQADARSAQPS